MDSAHLSGDADLLQQILHGLGASSCVLLHVDVVLLLHSCWTPQLWQLAQQLLLPGSLISHQKVPQLLHPSKLHC